jgi:hypothetical protein
VNRRIRSELDDRDLLELMVFATRMSLVVYAVSGLFVSRLYTEGAWWFILLPACLSRAVEGQARVQVRSAPVIEPLELPDEGQRLWQPAMS